MQKIVYQNHKFMNKYVIKKVQQSDKYFKRLLVEHKDKHIERSLRIIQLSMFLKSDKRNNLIMLQKLQQHNSKDQKDKENSSILKNIEKDLNKVKNLTQC